MTSGGLRVSKPLKEQTCVAMPVNLLAFEAVWNWQMFCIPARGQRAEGLQNGSTGQPAPVSHPRDPGSARLRCAD